MSSGKAFPEYGTRLLISDDWQSVHDVGEYEAETGIKTSEEYHWMKVKEHYALLQEKDKELSRLRAALEFYAEVENWDTQHYTPTIWVDGNVDLGRTAREALAGGKE